MIYVNAALMVPVMETKAKRLRAARSRLFESASQAAHAHGWTVSTYVAHENGQNDFGADRAMEYAKAFKVSPEWLVFGGRPSAGIDALLAELPADIAQKLAEKFAMMIEGVKVVEKNS